MGKAVAKSKPQAWRKLDASAVEEALVADSRALLRSAGAEHKTNDELFFVDKEGFGGRKGRRDPWVLKSTQILSPNDKIPVLPKNTVVQKKWHTEAGKLERMKAQLKETGVIAEFSRKKSRKAAPAPAAAARAFDLWGEEEEDIQVEKVVAPGAGICSIPATASNGWPTAYKNNPHVLENGVDTLDPEHFVSNNKRKHRSRNMKPVGSKVRAVEVVSGGASYRPSPAAHSILMSQAAAMLVQEEEKVKAQRLRLGLKEGQRIKRTSLARDGDLPGQDDLSDGDEQQESEEEEHEHGHAPTLVQEEHQHHRQTLRLALPSQTEGMDIEEKEQEKEEGGGGGGRKAGGKEAGKLTIAQRNKRLRHREHERAVQEAREAKRLSKQLNALGQINKEVKKQVMRSEEEARVRAELKPEREAEKIHRLGPQKLSVKDFIPDVELPEDIAPRLRVVKQSGSALRDKFLNLSKRNLVEPRKVTLNKRKNKTLNVRKSDKLKARAYIDF